MRAGKYRHRVHFQERVQAQDPNTGEVTVSWQTAYLDSDTPLDAVPAEVLTGPGKELIAAGAKQAETDARINCRWFPGLNQKWRVLWDGKVYDITGIETDVTARREWRLQCKEGLEADVFPVAAQSTATVPDGAVGSVTTLTAQARNQAGDPVTFGGATVAAVITGSNPQALAFTDNGDGTYTASYTPTAGVLDTIAITLNGAAISGSPFASVITAASAVESSADVPDGHMGEPLSVVVTVRDQFGEVWTGPAVVAGTFDGSALDFTDNEDGTYTAEFTPLTGGDKAVVITVNGVAITGSPFVSEVEGTSIAPVAWWNLDEASGTRADSVGSLDLTDNNTVESADGVGAGQTAASFVAANTEYLSRADNAALRIGNRDWTMCGWVYAPSFGTSIIAGKGGAATAAGGEYDFLTNSSGVLFFRARNSADTASVSVSTPSGTFVADTWFFFEAGYNATNDQLFLRINNGSALTAALAGGVRTDTGAFGLAVRPGALGNYWNGRLQSIGIFHGLLTDDDRAWLYNGGTAARLYP